MNTLTNVSIGRGEVKTAVIVASVNDFPLQSVVTIATAKNSFVVIAVLSITRRYLYTERRYLFLSTAAQCTDLHSGMERVIFPGPKSP